METTSKYLLLYCTLLHPQVYRSQLFLANVTEPNLNAYRLATYPHAAGFFCISQLNYTLPEHPKMPALQLSDTPFITRHGA